MSDKETEINSKKLFEDLVETIKDCKCEAVDVTAVLASILLQMVFAMNTEKKHFFRAMEKTWNTAEQIMKERLEKK